MTSPPVGKPVYGVYYEEVVAQLPLALLCVRELKYAGYTNQRLENSSVKDTIGSVGVVNTAGHITTSVVPGIPSKWLLGDATYADAYAFYLSRDTLPKALESLTISEAIIASLVVLAQKQISTNNRNDDMILLCTLLEQAGSSIQEEVRVAVSRCTMNRYHHCHYYYIHHYHRHYYSERKPRKLIEGYPHYHHQHLILL